MEPIPRKSDGRRVYTPEFKRQQIERVLRGEVTLSELSPELDISRGLLQRWKQLIASGAEASLSDAHWMWWMFTGWCSSCGIGYRGNPRPAVSTCIVSTTPPIMSFASFQYSST